MKIALVLHHAGAFRSLEDVVRHWHTAGHNVYVTLGDLPKAISVDQGLNACRAELNRIHVDRMRYRKDRWNIVNIRELINYANYLRPEHPTPKQALRWKSNIVRPIRKVIKRKWASNFLSKGLVRNALHKIESLIPCEPTITDWLETVRPDVVVASPFIFPLSQELEYIKAARNIGIPTAVIVLSWDNLTTKGTFHVIPNLTLVWNSVLADEAVLLHDVPRNTITVTGSPTFDFWFSMSPSTNYTDFANHVGFDSSKTFVLYLCSSHFIAEKEHLFVTEFVRAMKQNARTKNVSIVIRPHPLNDSIWKGFNIENTVIWPKVGQWVDIPEAKQLYYDTIYHSQAVVGVNTSAFLEAAILDKPCITVLSEQSKAKQTELGHFQHLINGEFLEITTSYQEAASILGSILTGGDVKQAQREKFVEDFIRPCGLNTPASQIMATAIESIGVRTDTD